ncbi:MAG: DegT/DnrJ/EryC1/StrS family aminotransferase [Clostridia bacterium]|nr:DegT/DnrJ/EryC1/StrS family aminotransferase [Clostridia bacterium]
MDKFIPVNTPLLDGNEKKYVEECVETGWISSEGEFVKRFEESMAHFVDRKYGISVTNATAGLEVAVAALGLKAGDEVIMPTFTIVSCIIPLVNRGIVPVLIDSDEKTFNMNVDEIESKITPKTRAIMVVHIYGLTVEMDKVLELAKKYNLKIIEDAAEVHGQTYKGKKCGSFGDISVFSFYANKIIATGEGGMIVTDSEELATKCKSIRNLCFKPERRFVHDELGFNYRMTNTQAAIGLAQLEKIDEHIEKKHFIGRKYTELLKDVDSINLPIAKTDYCENIYWVYAITLKKDYKMNAIQVMDKLKEEGIGTRPFFYPMHKQPVFNNKGMFVNEKYEGAEYISEKGFYVPSGIGITEEEMEIVADKVKKVLKMGE